MSIQVLLRYWRNQYFLPVMIVLAAIFIGLIGPSATAQTEKPTGETLVVPTVTPDPARLRHTENFLVLGADVQPGASTMQTDSMMLVAIDHDTQQVGVLSIPRDLWVDIPGWGADRISSAYYLGGHTKYKGGGPALAKAVVEKTLGLPIQHVVLIKIDGLVQLVDALGGVTVYLNCPLYERTPDPTNQTQLINWALPAGKVRLNGSDARKFATSHYLSSDFELAQRQQQLMRAIGNRTKSLDILPKVPQLWSALSGTFNTDLGMLDVIRLASFGLSLDPRKVTGAALDQAVVRPSKTSSGAFVVVIKDRASLNKRLAEMFAAKPLSDPGKVARKCPPVPPGFKDPGPVPAPSP